MNKLFLSHTWNQDNLGRNTHQRVLEIGENLKKMNWNIWIDEVEIINNIDAAIANGIENCDYILVFLTESYIKKINESARNPNTRDYCLKEWTYANYLKKIIIPIVFEPKLLNIDLWPRGIVSLQLASTFYLNCSNTDSIISANLINNYLIKINNYENKNNLSIQIKNNLNIFSSINSILIKKFKSHNKVLPFNQTSIIETNRNSNNSYRNSNNSYRNSNNSYRNSNNFDNYTKIIPKRQAPILLR